MPRQRSGVAVVLHDDGAETATLLPDHPLAAAGVEVLAGSVCAALERVTRRWLVIARPDAVIPLTWIRAVHTAMGAFMRGASTRILVPGDLVSADADENLRAALVSPYVLIHRSLTRGFTAASPLGADFALRAYAVARSARVQGIVVEAEAPSEPTGPRTGPLAPREAAAAWLDVFAQVESVSGAHPRIRRPLLAVKRALSTEVGRVVALDPAIRLDVFAEVERRGLTSFSQRMVNVEAAQDLAIVYGFPPFLDTGGFVVSRRFDTRSRAYDVLTQDMSRRRERDDRSLELARRNLGRRMVVREPLATGNWEQVERFCRKGMEMIAAREAEAGKYESVYSRSMWIAPSVLGAWYKARNPDTPWTAELSDPLAHRPNGELRPNPLPDNAILDEIRAAVTSAGRPDWRGDRFFEAVEWMIYALADRIVFTNENQRDFMLGAYPDQQLAARARTISSVEAHPVPDGRLYRIGAGELDLDPTKVNIGYFGNFYGVRGISDLLAPFAELDPAERTALRLLVFTPDAEGAAAAAGGHPAADVLQVFPARPYFDFLALTRRLDWLVVADARSPDTFPRNPFLPSKLADYRGSGTPIWGITEPGSVLHAQDLDEKSILGDVADGAAALRRILARSR